MTKETETQIEEMHTAVLKGTVPLPRKKSTDRTSCRFLNELSFSNGNFASILKSVPTPSATGTQMRYKRRTIERDGGVNTVHRCRDDFQTVIQRMRVVVNVIYGDSMDGRGSVSRSCFRFSLARPEPFAPGDSRDKIGISK